LILIMFDHVNFINIIPLHRVHIYPYNIRVAFALYEWRKIGNSPLNVNIRI
jgi:hypothetical protein